MLSLDDRCTLARVRLLAIAATGQAGGSCSPARMRRALRPIAAELAGPPAIAGDLVARVAPPGPGGDRSAARL